jgi:hypothetical protein
MQNMSNQVPDEFKEKITQGKKTKKNKGFWNIPLIRKPMMWLYNTIFRIYYK